MSTLARYKKAIVAGLGFAVTLVLLVPADQVPERWRPWVGLLLAVATVAGVRQVRNADPPTGLITSEPTRYVRPEPRDQPMPTPRHVRDPDDPLE
jgi:alpha-beta hydrolase superfamily lysophospholipase